jgi:hypothetical protein
VNLHDLEQGEPSEQKETPTSRLSFSPESTRAAQALTSDLSTAHRRVKKKGKKKKKRKSRFFAVL